jgi:hypothetical protein
VLSGDWSGMLLLWKLPPGSAAEQEAPVPAKKKRKDKAGVHVAAVSEVVGRILEAWMLSYERGLIYLPMAWQSPSATIKAHAQCVSGVQWDPTSNERGM